MSEYQEFLNNKVIKIKDSGFDVQDNELNPILFDFQKYIIKRALKAGKFAIFTGCGTGKTFMQAEWAKLVYNYTKKPVLVLCPLAVSEQTISEGKKLNIEIVKYNGTDSAIQISNYEQIDNIDTDLFSGIILDESSILKNYNGAYRNKIITKFKNTSFKLACTATPSPNDELEIGNHSEFLNVMDSVDMRSIFFTTEKSIKSGNKYRLKKYGEKDFFMWIASWAVMFENPNDLGFNEANFTLPKLNITELALQTDVKKNSQTLFNDISVNATNYNAELRRTKSQRLDKIVELVNNSTENFIIWIKQNEEGDYLKKLIPDSVEVKGSDSLEHKEKYLLGFAKNEFRVLITKSKIAQFGLNYQNCHNQIFASLDFSFESLYQSMKRSHRFGQKETVNVYLVVLDTMQNVINIIKEKQAKYEIMQSVLQSKLNEFNLYNMNAINVVKQKTTDYEIINNDCVLESKNIPDNSIGYTFFSPPFGALYVFSDNPNDMSNVKNNDEFLQHFNYLIPELLRITQPGRLVTMHVMQSTTLKGRDGYYSIVDFRGDLIRLFQKNGFYFHAEVMIRKDPKTAAIRTKNHQLMWGTTKKDSTNSRPGLADYLITFRKPGDNEHPIHNDIPFDLWCKMAEPVWIDIDESNTLTTRNAKNNNDERHLTATQLDVIERSYLLWSNPKDTIFCPFAGIGSEGVKALEMDRKFIGIELKKEYYDNMKSNLNNEYVKKTTAIELF